MSRAALSAQVFAVYVMGTGAAFVVAPNAVLSLFGVPLSTEPWVHVVGVLAFMIGIYAWVGGRHDHRPFLVASVYTRALVFVSFGALVLLDVAPPVLALFGAVDLLGALLTGLALRADERSATQRLDNGVDIFDLALHRVGWRIAALAPAPPVEGDGGEAGGEELGQWLSA